MMNTHDTLIRRILDERKTRKITLSSCVCGNIVNVQERSRGCHRELMLRLRIGVVYGERRALNTLETQKNTSLLLAGEWVGIHWEPMVKRKGST